MACTMDFRNGDVVRAICKLLKEIPKTELLSYGNPSMVGSVFHLKTTYLASTEKREAGMENGKSRGKVVNMYIVGFKRCAGTSFNVYGFRISLSVYE